jgi:hypothetical protein
MGRTPDFSVRETTGPAGVEGEGRAASFELPSPYGDARSAKSFEGLPLIFITDCCPIDWLQSVLKIRSFENIFFFFS